MSEKKRRSWFRDGTKDDPRERFRPGSTFSKDDYIHPIEYVNEQGGRSLPDIREKLDGDIARLCQAHDCTPEHLMRMLWVIAFRVLSETPVTYDSIMAGIDTYRAEPGVNAVLPTLRQCLAFIYQVQIEEPDEEKTREILASRGDAAREAVQRKIDEALRKRDEEADDGEGNAD